MTNRASIIEKIKALRSMTTDRGCTEAEAASAAAKAAQLMREARLSEDDLVLTESTAQTGIKGRSKAARLFGIIGYVTNCVAVEELNGDVLFVGRDPGPEIARYLLDVCETAVRVETARFKEGHFYTSRRKTATRRKAIADFQTGLVKKLGVRLYDLFRPTLNEHDRDRARDLVFRQKNVTVHNRSAHKTRFNMAEFQGRNAADQVGLHHGMKTGRDNVGRIGSTP
ncbi:MAG: DUF2786 domain-containing protein [Pseudomonadota bacterium]